MSALRRIGRKAMSSVPCCVNVRDFGAIGRALSTRGSIQAGSQALVVDSIEDWAEGSGIGIAGASAGVTSANQASLRTTVLCVYRDIKTLLLRDAAQNTVAHAVVTSDDGPPIQAAIDSLGTEGGTVCLPPGVYTIGVPQALTNQPIIVGSSVRVFGAGVGATVMQVCQESNVLWLADQAQPRTGFRFAGPIFLNASNFWWLGKSGQTQLPYYGLPHDTNIEIAGITFDGDKNHQTHLYTPDYFPNPTAMPAPTDSVTMAGTQVANGQLPAGTYWAFIRFADAGGNEGVGANAVDTVFLASPQNALSVTLPPVFPQGAVAVVPYLCRDDFSATVTAGAAVAANQSSVPLEAAPPPGILPGMAVIDATQGGLYLGAIASVQSSPPALNLAAPASNPIALGDSLVVRSDASGLVQELDPNTNPRYERQAPIPIGSMPGGIEPWNGQSSSPWPAITLTSHTSYPQAPAADPQVPVVPAQGNYPATGIVNFYGNAGDSFFGGFLNVDNLYVHDIEIRNFVADGFNITNVNNSIFARIHSHDNGRDGVSITTEQLDDVEFVDCVFASNANGVDMESVGGVGLRWIHCSFLDSGAFGVALQSVSGCRDVLFESCVFDGNTWHLQTTGSGPIYNFMIRNCQFRNNDSNCIVIEGGQGIFGEISGCEFDQANGRSQRFGPNYDFYARDVPAILLAGANTNFRITNNHFIPFAAEQAGQNFYSSQYMIDVSAAGPQTIQSNHFQSNPLDNRPPVAQGSTSQTKNQNFLFSLLDGSPAPLSAHRITGNFGDGLIWTGTVASRSTIPCGLDLEEKGVQAIPSGAQTCAISFVYALPAPPEGNYIVSAAFSWDSGGWWLTAASMWGCTLNWEKPAPAQSGSFAPQVVWTARFVA
ncbi:MAG TPA: right-handed parallel beta-helix repeat-containing protein [Bryobacteraceae bacterium]